MSGRTLEKVGKGINTQQTDLKANPSAQQAKAIVSQIL